MAASPPNEAEHRVPHASGRLACHGVCINEEWVEDEDPVGQPRMSLSDLERLMDTDCLNLLRDFHSANSLIGLWADAGQKDSQPLIT
jgi:hypothetical protein